jgi:DNA-directed RNA polymerase specialized sigma54-like protein
MKIPALAELKKELNYLDEKELVGLLIDLSKFSRDNKAFLHFKLSERDQPSLFVDSVKEDLEELFQTANTKTFFFAKKSAQTIRRKLNKSLKLSKKKEDQVELLLYFCEQLQRYGYLKFQHPIIKHLFDMQVKKIQQGIAALHEDLQYDYQYRLDDILDERS